MKIDEQIACAKEFADCVERTQLSGYAIVQKRLVSERTLRMLDEYIIFCPPAKKVKELMSTFFTDLKKRLQAKEDTIRVAAFAHMQFVRIHPFLCANGRVARMLMNLILMQGGHQPIAFVFDRSYTAAIREEEAGRIGAFEGFIRPIVRQFDYEALPISALPEHVLMNRERWVKLEREWHRKPKRKKMDQKR